MHCPECGYVFETQALVGEQGQHSGYKSPKPGDYTVCINCAALGVYELDFIGLRVRTPTEGERAEAESNPVITKAIWAAEQVRDRRRRG